MPPWQADSTSILVVKLECLITEKDELCAQESNGGTRSLMHICCHHRPLQAVL